MPADQPVTQLPLRPSDFVQSLDRGLAVIRAFGHDRQRLTLSEVARETGLTRAAARRFLITLQTLGYVDQDGRQFSLRPAILELGFAYLSSFSLTEIAQEQLLHVAEELQESCSASVLDGAEIVYVARAFTKRLMSINLNVGSRLPAVNTSMGRILLAGLEPRELDELLGRLTLVQHTPHTITDPEALRAEILRIRSTGWCLIDQELEIGVRSVAVPVYNERRRIVAALNVSGHATRVPIGVLTGPFLDRIQRAADLVTAQLGSRI